MESPPPSLFDLLGRYVFMTEHQRIAVALWVIHTHCVERFEQTPYLFISSPEKQCGKSRLLELLELLVARGWLCFNPSEPVVYRTIDRHMPTLLLDEVDAIFNPRTADHHEGLRAILNSGHRRGATVPRCVGVGTNLTVHNFEVYSAKALAGIGTLPDTIADRSIPIRLQRKTRAEHVERFLMRKVLPLTEPMRDSLAAWAAAHGDALAAAEPDMPEEFSDRMQEGCEPLLAIADLLGCGGQAREALVSLLTAERVDSTERAQHNLLRDIRSVFTARGDPPAIRTEGDLQGLLTALHVIGWDSWYGRGINANDLAALLKPYGIESRNVRTADGVGKGYRRDDFAEAWARYLSEDELREPEEVIA